MPDVRINLTTTDGRSDWIRVGSANWVSLDVQPASGKTWASAVAGLEYSLEVGTEGENPRTFDPTVTFTTSKKSRVNVPVRGKGNVRLATTTAEVANDEAARVVYLLG